MKISELKANTNIADGIFFDGTSFFVTCPECGHEQGDMGANVSCEECGSELPMPTHEDLDWLEED